jgi:hypothetical protein
MKSVFYGGPSGRGGPPRSILLLLPINGERYRGRSWPLLLRESNLIESLKCPQSKNPAATYSDIGIFVGGPSSIAALASSSLGHAAAKSLHPGRFVELVPASPGSSYSLENPQIKKAPHSMSASLFYGGPSENRTRMPVKAQVFETCASTNSAKGPFQNGSY